MRIYDINQTDGTVINPAGRDAPTDPMRETPRIPAGATDIEPPESTANKTAQWQGGHWELVEDFRGTVYYTQDGQRFEITQLGITKPSGVLDSPPEPEPVKPEYSTYKSDIWQRCTDAEAETLDGQLEQAPAKQRRMWNDAITIEHSSEYFSLLRDNMIEEFGEERTDEILAPSNGS